MAEFALNCPVPVTPNDIIQMAHGSGGTVMHRLLESVFMPAFSDPAFTEQHDGASLSIGGARLAYTTDSFVVRPLFFPGGDIGTLAVNGTVNDLAMCGARPLYLSAGFILEEGLPLDTLKRVVESMRLAAAAAGVAIVTGDTKVVDKGRCDGLYINTSGIGVIEHDLHIAPSSVCIGDNLILSGDIGRHGMAVMAVREGLGFESEIVSDCAPLAAPVLSLIESGIRIHCLRDLTRGGLATTLVEIARSARLRIHIDEAAIPVNEDVRGACEILGLDPLYVANEGRFVAFVSPADTARTLELLGPESRSIGSVTAADDRGILTLRSTIGAVRILDMLSGEQLPRIC
ncbi:MAG: hydrogenase expression/formation protein HypE [Chloroflexi bacterium]|nr:hydrogenase expression/formation protein HypE [Chloroflexota bacterium]